MTMIEWSLILAKEAKVILSQVSMLWVFYARTFASVAMLDEFRHQTLAHVSLA